MHPHLEYIVAQQRAEQLRRQAEHSRLIREIRRKTMGPSTLRLALARFRSRKIADGNRSTRHESHHGVVHENCGHTCRTEDDIKHMVKRENSRV